MTSVFGGALFLASACQECDGSSRTSVWLREAGPIVGNTG